MSRRQEKRRKFHEAVLNMLYPPPPSPPPTEDADGTENTTLEEPGADTFPGELGDGGGVSSADDGDDAECGQQKLTRAQRKRIRKKKLKEDIDRRGKIIGPLLPPSGDCGCSTREDETGATAEDESKGVRGNAEVETGAETRDQGKPAASTKQKRVKHRRTAKRQARDGVKASDREKIDQSNESIY